MTEPVVKIEQGSLKGKIVANDYNDGIYYSFRGIPYAKPPLGKLRFKAPQPPTSWDGLFDATKDGNECFQRHVSKPKFIGSEDCLVLNVYTPELPNRLVSTNKDGLKPVMVWIHGGSYKNGSCKTDQYGPDFLISEDVVVVTFNYRLGVLGFLSLKDQTLGVPGNAGFKDMVMALKWVQNNIKHFNGDHNNVTIFGESVGGVAVHLMTLSPMAKGLFHKAIAQSGNALVYWACGYHFVDELAKSLGIKSKDERKFLDCLENLSLEQILKAQMTLYDELEGYRKRPLGFIIENSSSEPMFLSKNPLDLIKSGDYNTKVPLIIGYTSRDGMISQVFDQFKGKRLQLVTDFEKAVPYNLRLVFGSDLSKCVASRIKEFYYGDEDPGYDNLDSFFLLQTDNLCVRELNRSLVYQRLYNKAPIYLYRMSVDSRLNFYKILNKIQSPGVCHADDVSYLFKMPMTPCLRNGSIEKISIFRFIKLWTNFARHGNPNPPNPNQLINVEWKPIESGNFNFLEIGENLTVGVNPDHHRIAFWNEIYKTYPIKSNL